MANWYGLSNLSWADDSTISKLCDRGWKSPCPVQLCSDVVYTLYTNRPVKICFCSQFEAIHSTFYSWPFIQRVNLSMTYALHRKLLVSGLLLMAFLIHFFVRDRFYLMRNTTIWNTQIVWFILFIYVSDLNLSIPSSKQMMTYILCFHHITLAPLLFFQTSDYKWSF